MNKTLILVVEDDRPIRNLIVTTLKTHDYKYLAAENGSSAILEASSHNPDIVLLDLGLPDMEGVEAVSYTHLWRRFSCKRSGICCYYRKKRIREKYTFAYAGWTGCANRRGSVGRG